MTLQYESIYYDRSQTGETRFEIYDNKTYQIVKVTVTPVDDNNTLNLFCQIKTLSYFRFF